MYFLFMFLMIATYLRTIWVINMNPGVVPLGPMAVERRKAEARKPKKLRKDDLEGQPYYVGPDQNPDSPGLEDFYTKDAFICEDDGRPKWCSECCNWKPDRAHHSSEINRCVIRMDHYCPWVGGIIGENCRPFRILAA
jgi:palmitoyltransferase